MAAMGVKCNACSKIYPTRNRLHSHIKEVHKTKPSLLGHHEEDDWHFVCLEDNCQQLCKSAQVLMVHLQKIHSFIFEESKITLKNMEEFEQWKATIEEDNTYKYVLKNTTDFKDYKLMYYRCNRCHEPEQMKNKSELEQQSFCTSHIKLFKEHKKAAVKIFWVKTHYGHDIKPEDLKAKIDEYISKTTKGNQRGHKRKKSTESIDADITINAPGISSEETAEQQGNQLNVKNEGKHNIKQELNESVVMNSGCDTDPILFHKRQESKQVEHFETNDFCLIIMNNYQKDMLRRFGNNLVLIDSTQSLNNHDFDLTMLAVLDEFNQGFPVAFMLCNRKDQLTFTFFFKTIKKAIGVICPMILMTDLMDSYYDAWIKIMEAPMYHLFCPWRVDQAWKLDLKKISNTQKQQEVSEILMTLQSEPEEYNFQIMLNDILTYLLEDKKTEQFGKYFKNNYCNNYQKWAFCLQKECIHSETNLESFHQLTNCLEQLLLNNKSFDKVLQTIFKYIGDNILERNSKIIEEKPLKLEVVRVNDYWEVKEEHGGYIVKKFLDKSCCESHCPCCKVCPHMYVCECSNYQTKKNICIHIHCAINDQSSKTTTVNVSQNESINSTNTDLIPVAKKNKKNNSANTVETRKSIHSKGTARTNSKGTASAKLNKKIESTISKLQTVQLNNLSNSVIKQIGDHLDIIHNLLKDHA